VSAENNPERKLKRRIIYTGNFRGAKINYLCGIPG